LLALLKVSTHAVPHTVLVHLQPPFTQLGAAAPHTLHEAPQAVASVSALQLLPHL
jgi:hypothetical protein